MKRVLAFLLLLFFVMSFRKTPAEPAFFSPADSANALFVRKVDNFTITGDGSSLQWKAIESVQLPQRSQGSGQYTTTVKTSYSNTGMYFLFTCPDKKLSATMRADGMRLWTEDVAEFFLWPDQQSPDYFEYEISPLNHELVLMLSNHPGKTVRWQPFPFDPSPAASHKVSIQGGTQKSNAAITGWTAEIYLPFALLQPLKNVPPAAGTRWRANFYRVDYDDPKASSDWSWQPVEQSYHEYEKFGTLIFQ